MYWMRMRGAAPITRGFRRMKESLRANLSLDEKAGGGIMGARMVRSDLDQQFGVGTHWTDNPGRQHFDWTSRYHGPGNGGDDAFAAAVDRNNNVIVTGSLAGSNSGVDCATIKYSAAGVLVFTNTTPTNVLFYSDLDVSERLTHFYGVFQFPQSTPRSGFLVQTSTERTTL